MNASESDSVVFVGNGVTGAVHKLIHALDFKQPPVSSLMLLSVSIYCNSQFHTLLLFLKKLTYQTAYGNQSSTVESR